MAVASHLLDKSAWVQAPHSADVASRLAGLMRRGRLAVCTMTALEILFSARNRADYERDHERLARLPWCDLAEPQRAVAVQRSLAERGWHRASLPDVVIAATAGEHGLTVLHYDSDYERVAPLAGAQHEWVLPRGTGHGGNTPS